MLNRAKCFAGHEAGPSCRGALSPLRASLAGIAGCCLGLALSASRLAAPAKADPPNWLYLGSQGEGFGRTSMLLDLNSAHLQPTGVTTFRWMIETYNTLNFEKIDVKMSAGIDCATKESVDPKTGGRKPLGEANISNPEFSSPVIVAFRNFCAKPAEPMKVKP